MSKTAIIYWSGTGNTEAMANAVINGMKDAGADASLIPCDRVSGTDISQFDAIAFGCPAMGAEVIEEDEFAPMFNEIKGSLAGKKIALFGSYGWGDGTWMREWEDDCKSSGIELAADSVICCEAPDDAAVSECFALGKTLAG